MTTAVDDRSHVSVSLADRSYEIRIGPGVLDEAAQAAKALGASKIAVVTDENVAALHLEPVMTALAGSGLAARAFIVPPGEKSKSFQRLEYLCSGLIEAKIERSDVVLALGGGVIGDLAGFAAAVLLRGVGVIQAPTTLLAQVDSSVGGKTGINVAAGKNLIGSFHQPSLVLADTDVLDTLPIREFRAGYAEALKYGLIGDTEFFNWLERHWSDVFAGGAARTRIIAKSCSAKASVVARDEFETGERALLNLGHTFAHALEAAVAFDGDRLVHGEAVAIGMALAFRFSASLGLVSEAEVNRVVDHLKAVGLPTSISQIPGGDLGGVDRLMNLMTQDKKVRAGRLTFILTRGIGRSFIAPDIPPQNVRSFLEGELSPAPFAN